MIAPARRRRTRGMPPIDLCIPVAIAPTSDPERVRALLALGLELLACRRAREQAAEAAAAGIAP